MTDAAWAAIEALFSFIIGCSIGLLYCHYQWKKWLKNHRCGDVTVEVHGGGGWGDSGLQIPRGGFSDMTSGRGGASSTSQTPPLTMKNSGASS